MTEGFHDTVRRPRQDFELCDGRGRAIGMEAVHLCPAHGAVNPVPHGDVTRDRGLGDAEGILDHLHAAAYAENRQVARPGQLHQQALGLVALRRIAAIACEVVAAGQQEAGHGHRPKHCPRGCHMVRHRQGDQAAGGEQPDPALVERIPPLAAVGIDVDPLADGDQPHQLRISTRWLPQSRNSMRAEDQR